MNRRCETFVLMALLAFVVAFFLACRGGGVDTAPYVEYDRRIENNNGEGVRIGVSFSPSPLVDPWRPGPLNLPTQYPWLPEPEPEPEGIEIETPWGPIGLGGGVGLLLLVLWLQKRGVLPSPRPKDTE